METYSLIEENIGMLVLQDKMPGYDQILSEYYGDLYNAFVTRLESLQITDVEAKKLKQMVDELLEVKEMLYRCVPEESNEE